MAKKLSAEELAKIKEFDEISKLNKDVQNAIKYISEFWDVHCCTIIKNGGTSSDVPPV